MIVLVQSSFHTTWASLFEMELELNSPDWNGNELEHELEQEDVKRTPFAMMFKDNKQHIGKEDSINSLFFLST